MELLKNKTALVTGAAQGIGREIALVFAEQGADVLMADIASEKVAAAAREIAGTTGRRVSGVALDVSNKNQVEATLRVMVEQFGGIDILVSFSICSYIKKNNISFFFYFL